MSQKFAQQDSPNVLSLGKIPPQNLEAEQAILASILIDNHALNICLEYIKSDDFYKEAHKIIYSAMIELNERNEPTDLVTLNHHLENKNNIELVGGSAYLSHLVDSVPTAANVAAYSKLVREKSLLRKLIQAGTDIVTDCFQSEQEVGDLLDTAEHKIFSVSEQKVSKGFSPVKDLVKTSYKMIEDLFENKSKITGVPTGFTDFDEQTAGLHKGELIIVAGRPSMGKTAFAINIVENAAMEKNAKVAVFSLEMSKESLVMRMLTSQARIDASSVRIGDLKESDWPKLLGAADTLAHMNVFIDDQPGQSSLEIRAKVRRLAKEVGGLDLIVVDYLQLMRAGIKTQSREQEISEISRSLKGIAKELKVPVIALSQLNRSLENRTNKRPMMSDLRESGAIEQDADLIVFIYRDEVYDTNTPDKGVAEIIIGKQRNGVIGTSRLAFVSQFTRFEDLAFEQDYHFDPAQDAETDIDPNDVI
jgi:replicative DNA helicase